MINETIKKINEYLKKEFWMNFELEYITFGEAELIGKKDEPYEKKIKIAFKGVDMISCRTLFAYEGGGDNFIYILTTGEEVNQINSQYSGMPGTKIFALINTSCEEIMYIMAKDIEVDFYQ